MFALWARVRLAAGACAVEEWGNRNLLVSDVIDADGFRPNVGIILVNDDNRLFWGRRVGQDAWQFPQGGIKEKESPREAMFRELEEEVGLKPEHVEVLGETRRWLRYRLPKRFIRRHAHPICIGQKQRWFLLRVNCKESDFCFDRCDKPEFDGWRWVSYWEPVRDVIYFKRRVYERALEELAPLLFPEGAPERPKPRPRHRPAHGRGRRS
jgi:putative (di)nucleoside polyphosphate hydrolase